MIKASFTRTEDKTFLFKIDGHAGQNDKGHDIVCSAASILAYTLAQTMRYIEEQILILQKFNKQVQITI